MNVEIKNLRAETEEENHLLEAMTYAMQAEIYQKGMGKTEKLAKLMAQDKGNYIVQSQGRRFHTPKLKGMRGDHKMVSIDFGQMESRVMYMDFETSFEVDNGVMKKFMDDYKSKEAKKVKIFANLGT